MERSIRFFVLSVTWRISVKQMVLVYSRDTWRACAGRLHCGMTGAHITISHGVYSLQKK